MPRKASVDYIEPVAEGDEAIVCERDGDDIFVATRTSSSILKILASLRAIFLNVNVLASNEAFVATRFRASLMMFSNIFNLLVLDCWIC